MKNTRSLFQAWIHRNGIQWPSSHDCRCSEDYLLIGSGTLGFGDSSRQFARSITTRNVRPSSEICESSSLPPPQTSSIMSLFVNSPSPPLNHYSMKVVSNNRLTKDMRRTVLSGGPSMFPGICDRIQNELKALCPHIPGIKVRPLFLFLLLKTCLTSVPKPQNRSLLLLNGSIHVGLVDPSWQLSWE